ncbi:unnamed protein product [Amoebophrya sp. A120]|nr:unnamed protein product [Amoebophrya sp. A120]|eukprot:GSA120T00005241001.1
MNTNFVQSPSSSGGLVQDMLGSRSASMSSSTQHYSDPGTSARATTNGEIALGGIGEWIFFGVAFVLLMVFDSVCLLRGISKMTLKQSALYVLFYFLCALGFWGFIVFVRGVTPALQWSTGYLLEWMLSVDNLFVYRVIFEMYKCPSYLQQKPLFLGIIGVIVLRLLLFAVGEWLYHSISFVYLILGGFLVYTGVKVVVTDEDDDEDPTQGRVIQWLAKRIPLVSYYDADGRFFVQVSKHSYDDTLADSPTSADRMHQHVDLQNSNLAAGLEQKGGSSSTSKNIELAEVVGNNSSSGNMKDLDLEIGGSGSGAAGAAGSTSAGPGSKTAGEDRAGGSNESDNILAAGSPNSDRTNGELSDEGIPKKHRSLVRRFPYRSPSKSRSDSGGAGGTPAEELQTRCTMSFLVACCLAATDVVFAVDSASAIIAQIPDIYLAYTACAFATLGLRATFFMVSELIALFSLLKYGVGFVLVFTGGKLMLEKVVKIPDSVTAGIMLSTFAICILGSYLLEKFNLQKATEQDPNEAQKGRALATLGGDDEAGSKELLYHEPKGAAGGASFSSSTTAISKNGVLAGIRNGSSAGSSSGTANSTSPFDGSNVGSNLASDVEAPIVPRQLSNASRNGSPAKSKPT